MTCPTVRIHPAVIAQAAATAAVQMLDGKFVLGVGSGENLNEHVTGARWPETDVRLEMLEEAVDIIRKLHHGEFVSHHGTHYTVENARIYTLPDKPCRSTSRASDPRPSSWLGRIADGFVSTSPEADDGQAVPR